MKEFNTTAKRLQNRHSDRMADVRKVMMGTVVDKIKGKRLIFII